MAETNTLPLREAQFEAAAAPAVRRDRDGDADRDGDRRSPRANARKARDAVAGRRWAMMSERPAGSSTIDVPRSPVRTPVK